MMCFIIIHLLNFLHCFVNKNVICNIILYMVQYFVILYTCFDPHMHTININNILYQWHAVGNNFGEAELYLISYFSFKYLAEDQFIIKIKV